MGPEAGMPWLDAAPLPYSVTRKARKFSFPLIDLCQPAISLTLGPSFVPGGRTR